MASEDLLMKFDKLVYEFKREFNEIIEQERTKMMAEVPVIINQNVYTLETWNLFASFT